MVVTKDDVVDIVKLLLINNQKALQGYVIGSLYYKVGEYGNALKYVSRYLTVHTNSFLAYKLQGECYEKLNQPDDALKSYQNAIKIGERRKQLKRRGSCSEEEIKAKHFCGTSELLNSSLSTIATNGIEHAATTDNEVDIVKPMQSPTSNRQIENSDMFYDEIGSAVAVSVKFTVKHISTLDAFTCSLPFSFQNLCWRILVAPKRDKGPSRAMSLYLLCKGDTNASWSCHVDAEYRLLSAKSNQYPHVKKLRHTFNKEDDSWGFPEFVSWNDVVSPESNYVLNDSITVEVYLELVD